MSWSAHPRTITNEQFTDGTTIDGDRLQKALKDLESRFNDIPRGDIKTKWLPTQFISGWSPTPPQPSVFPFNDQSWPFLRSINQVNDIVTDAGDLSNITNKNREKGYRIPGIDPDIAEPDVGLSGDPQQYIWETTLFFSDPVVLVDWTVFLIIDSPQILDRYYKNDWTWHGPDTPEGISVGDLTKDLVLNVSVDCELDREDRSLSDVEVKKSNFKVALKKFSQIDWPNPLLFTPPEMSVLYAGGPLAGVALPLSLYVPIHQRSRVRLSIIFPKYPPTYVNTPPPFAGAPQAWTEYPWSSQVMNSCLTVMEPIIG
tara:strand:- start:15288 stop:16229 length:942 start_codon:yes stop_codon:yes gene_type:complete